MKSLNKVQLIGRTGTDVKFSEKGVARMSIATNYQTKEEEKTDWHNVVAFGKLAEIAEKHVSKGNLLYIEGHLKNSSWKDKDGVDRFSTDIVADELLFLTPKN